MFKKDNANKSSSWLLKILLFFGVVLVVFVGFIIFKETNRKKHINEEIDKLKAEAARIEKENKEMIEKISYFESQDFKMLEAKDKLNLKEQDENMVIVKPSPGREATFVAGASNSEKKSVTSSNNKNYLKWWNYFFKY